MQKYRHKPTEVKAIQLTHYNLNTVAEWVGDAGEIFNQYRFFIHTIEGSMEASAGDYILKGIKSEFYPVKKDIFEASYEKLP